ncbi:uncharacterized protein [Macaca nemestrina]|uniref:uncharacterized protein n=1 Tax=Macaca nemestrina TaxID=9545 RepID=UPI0005F448DD|nr:uncharacterized protein LOC105473727 [Macaca nemestrina]
MLKNHSSRSLGLVTRVGDHDNQGLGGCQLTNYGSAHEAASPQQPGWAPAPARPGAGDFAAAAPVTGVSRALGPGGPSSPRGARGPPSSFPALCNSSSPETRWLSRSQESRLSRGPGGGEEEFCPDSAAVGSRQAFSWVSPGKVAKLFFTCKNMLFIFQSLLVNLEIADSPAQTYLCVY